MSSDPPEADRATTVYAHGDVPARVAGYAIDTVITSVASLVLLAVLGVVHGPVVEVRGSGDLADRIDVDRVRLALDTLVITSFSACYFSWSWVARGATPGQRVVGLVVLPATRGQRVTVSTAVIRFTLLGAPVWIAAGFLSGTTRLTLWGVALAWYVVLAASVARPPSTVGLHDRIAGTMVVRRVTPVALDAIESEPVVTP